MKVHQLKLRTAYFKAQANGQKTFEIRFNDRDYRVGDVVVLREFDGEKLTGRKVCREITYISDFGQVNGWAVLATAATTKAQSVKWQLEEGKAV